MNDGALREFAVELQRVDEEIVGTGRELLDGVQHGEARCVIDVDLIDARGINRGNRPGDGVFANSDGEFFAAFADSSLESRSPRMRYCGSRMTAAATTGPNSDPRPTSSTPATSVAPRAQASFSNFSVQRSFFSRRSLAADAEMPGLFEDLRWRGTFRIFAEEGAGCKRLAKFSVEKLGFQSSTRQRTITTGDTGEHGGIPPWASGRACG